MNIREIGKKPIEEENPVGMDLSDDADFEKLTNEMDKLTSITSNEPIDWNIVKNLALDITENKSKNLLVLFWLSVAMIKTDGIKGFIDSLFILNGAVQEYWENMFPPKKRIRGRKNAINWWVDKIDSEFTKIPPIIISEEEFNEIISEFKDFDMFIGENLDDAPVLKTLIDKLSDLLEIEKKEIEDKTDGINNIKQNTVSTQNSEINSPEISAENISDALKQASGILSEVSNAIAKIDKFNYVIFRLNRLSAWSDVDTLPPNENNETLIPPPDEQFISALKNLYEQENWEALLEASESRISQYLFWIDLSFYSFTALNRLNYTYEAESIALDTLQYIKKLKNIEKLTFSGGMPFADNHTRMWLDDIQTSSSKTKTETLADKEQNLVYEKLEEAVKLINSNKNDEAINMYREELLRAPSNRLKFLWMSGMCKLLSITGKDKLLNAYFDEIEKLVDKYSLMEWEPELAAEAFAIMLSSMGSSKEYMERKKRILNKIAIVNPLNAINFV